MRRGVVLGWVFLWTARPQRRALQFSQKNTLEASSSIMASEVRSEGTRERAAKPQAAQERESFLSSPFAIASPLAWLLATPPNGELARRLEKMTNARQIPGGGGGRKKERPAIMIYPVDLWNPCDFRRFPTTFRKCRNVCRSVFRRRLSTSEATLGDSLVKEPKIHFRIKLLH